MTSTIAIRLPTNILASFRAWTQIRSLNTRLQILSAKEKTTALRETLLRICCEKANKANLEDAISLAEQGCLLPSVLYNRTQQEFDRLLPSISEKDALIASLNDTLREHEWRVELRTAGTYSCGWTERKPRHSLVLHRLTDYDRQRFAEESKRAQFPAYGHAARLFEEQCYQAEFNHPDGNAFIAERMQLLGSLFDIPVDDNQALAEWAEGLREIDREYSRRGFSRDWG